MKRRAFFGTAAAVAASTTSSEASIFQRSGPGSVTDSTGRLAGKTLIELRDRYRRDLFEEYFPYLEEHAVDWEYGGFMCNRYADGTPLNTDKRSWYEGRGIWVYSYLYNRFGRDPKNLQIAAKTADFALGLVPEGNQFMAGTYTREGSPLSPGDIYSELFLALGLQELARVSGYERYRDEAARLVIKGLRIYDRPDYVATYFTVPSFIKLDSMEGLRHMGHWMIMLRVVSQMLESAYDPVIKAIADRCVDSVINYHYNPEYGLLNEYLNHDNSRHSALARYCYLGHGIEILWFMMDHALVIGDHGLFETAEKMFIRHCEVAWDYIYTGFFTSLDDVEKNRWSNDIIMLFQVEALIGISILVENTGSEWSKKWYAKVLDHIDTKYGLKPYGYNPWEHSGDRAPKDKHGSGRIGNYHYPQAILLNLLSVERMIRRRGRVA